MTYADAAVLVLKAAGKPLTVKQIVVEAMRRRLILPKGKDPVRTMSARLYVDPPDGVTRVFKRGPRRARRGSVRWIFR